MSNLLSQLKLRKKQKEGGHHFSSKNIPLDFLDQTGIHSQSNDDKGGLKKKKFRFSLLEKLV